MTDWEDEQDFDCPKKHFDQSPHNLHRQVDAMACEITGHKPSKQYPFWAQGKEFYVHCSRCFTLLSGNQWPEVWPAWSKGFRELIDGAQPVYDFIGRTRS